jgi:hypothetical protein
MKATQSSWIYLQNVLFIEFLFKLQALEHISCADSVQIIYAKKMCLDYYDFEPNIHSVVKKNKRYHITYIAKKY